mmetsp:Transcript_64389/g.172319  ORF Transcript_64389/g.172319 Transcript_64389/m.172319 type:complete len:240 (+) Transcript_64389:181-900(+)
MMEFESRPMMRCQRESFEESGWTICSLPTIQGPATDKTNRFLDALMYSKFNAWRLTEYQAVLLLDSDTMAVGDPTGAFRDVLPRMLAANRSLAAARDRPADTRCRFGTSWNHFNAGVLLLLPSLETFAMLNRSISEVPHNVDSAEQDLLNRLYHEGDHQHEFMELPFPYNAIVITKYCQPDVWDKHRGDLRLIHMTTAKGWMYSSHWDKPGDPFECWWWGVQDLCAFWETIPAPDRCRS